MGLAFSENREDMLEHGFSRLRAERDTALAELAQVKEQLTEATRALCAIQDKAVCDWDDPTVGETRRALENVPQTYRDAYVAWARWAVEAHKRAERAEEALVKYGRHDPLCAVVGGYERGCTCGLDAALAPASAQEGGEHA